MKKFFKKILYHLWWADDFAKFQAKMDNVFYIRSLDRELPEAEEFEITVGILNNQQKAVYMAWVRSMIYREKGVKKWGLFNVHSDYEDVSFGMYIKMLTEGFFPNCKNENDIKQKYNAPYVQIRKGFRVVIPNIEIKAIDNNGYEISACRACIQKLRDAKINPFNLLRQRKFPRGRHKDEKGDTMKA